MRSLLRNLLLSVTTASLLFGTVSQTKTSGVWSSTGTWTSGILPTQNDTVIISAGHTMTIDGDYFVRKVTVESNATVQFDGVTDRYISTYGDFTVEANGRIIPSAPFATGTAYVGMGVGGNLTVNGMIKDTVKGSVSGTRFLQQIKMTYHSLASGKTSIQGTGTINAMYLYLQKFAGTDTVFVKPGPTVSVSYIYLEGGTLDNSKNNISVFTVSRTTESSVLTAVPKYAATGAGVSYLAGSNITAGVELPDTVKNFDINLNKTVTVNKNIVVTGSLGLNNGRINMGNYTLRVNGLADNYGQKGYVIGGLERPISVNKYDSVKIFCVGTTNGYAEVTVRLDTVKTAGSLLVRSYESMYNQVKDTMLSLKRYWTFSSKNGLTFGKSDVTLRYDAKDFKNNVSESSDEKSLIVGKNDLVNFLWFWSFPPVGLRDTAGAGGTIQAKGMTDLTTTLVVVKNVNALSVLSRQTAPLSLDLGQNFPNPFNPSTAIEYHIAENGPASLKVFDLLGKEVMTLVDGHQHAGRYSVRLNGSSLSSGCYFYTLSSGGRTMTKKLLLMK